MGKGKLGRKRGTRNRGYHYRKGRGWYALDGNRRTPLCYADGRHIKVKDTNPVEVEQAYRRWQVAQQAQQRAAAAEATTESSLAEATLEAVCGAYLAHVKATGAKSTYYGRANTLFDFCRALPGRCRPKGETPPAVAERCHHHAYGQLAASALTALHIDEWLNAHPAWKGCRRLRIQALKRAMSYGVERQLIKVNPIAGYKVGKSRGRITYFTPEQEAALLRQANPGLRMAIQVCIRTGLRYGAEYIPLTAQQIVDLGDRMEWRVTPKRTKRSEKYRLVRVADAAIIALAREQINRHPAGPIFRNERGDPWKGDNLTMAFTRLRRRVERIEGIQFDADACMNTCRHTYAKRTLQGYWTGKPTTTETLARLMGNTPHVCWEHYVQWCEAYNSALWEAC